MTSPSNEEDDVIVQTETSCSTLVVGDEDDVEVASNTIERLDKLEKLVEDNTKEEYQIIKKLIDNITKLEEKMESQIASSTSLISSSSATSMRSLPFGLTKSSNDSIDLSLSQEESISLIKTNSFHSSKQSVGLDDSDDEESTKKRASIIHRNRKKKRTIVMGFNTLNEDTYTLMMASDGYIQKSWILGFIVFLFQLALCGVTIYSQLVVKESQYNHVFLQIPIHTKLEVTALQFISIFIAVYGQEDVFNAIALPIDYRLSGPHPWGGFPVDDERKGSRWLWISKLLLPNIFKFLQGIAVLVASFIVILQSRDVIDLLKDFTALYVISSIDDIIFNVARRGFLGKKLKHDAADAEEIDMSLEECHATKHKESKCCNGDFVKTLLLHSLLVFFFASWSIVLFSQKKGILAREKYPNCRISQDYESDLNSFQSNWTLLENSICNMEFNHADCAYDGEDRIEFNQIYPGCRVDDISLLGDGVCNGPPYNSKLCRYDGGDCSIELVIKAKYPLCEEASPAFSSNWSLVENGLCNMEFNVPQCGMDGGDCTDFNLFYPGCNNVKDAKIINASKIGDGFCDGYPYNSDACLFDGGDCRQDAIYCSTSFIGKIGDSKCDRELNIWQCYFDQGDCSSIQMSSDPSHKKDFGDGNCESDNPTINNYYEGGDCIHPGYIKCFFTKDYPNFVAEINDGKCHNTPYHNTEACGWDGGDCIDFKNKYPNCTVGGNRTDAWKIGDDRCDTSFNNTECGFDEGDCCEGAERDDFCMVKYNTVECGYDRGDCIEFNTNYSNCTVEDPSRVGDGICNRDEEGYNTLECKWDGGDCISLDLYPDCSIELLTSLGDGICDGGFANTKECGWDGGDCDDMNEALWLTYPECNKGVFPPDIGDGICRGENTNTEECGWDGGDCIEFNNKYPDCVAIGNLSGAWRIGDGQCDEVFNIIECGFDEGDCCEGSVQDDNCVMDYNTIECGLDRGDCIEFNSKYPFCTAPHPSSSIGDGFCDTDNNNEECGWDGGDCIIQGDDDVMKDDDDFFGYYYFN